MDKRNKAVIQAVNKLKRGKFKATAIKVELEENLYRNRSEDDCQTYLMERFKPLGLSKLTGWGWIVAGPLRYAQFYNDHSVDSELTFTLSLRSPKDILLLPKIIDIWNDFADWAGDSRDVDGAGMHIALLNDPECEYPVNSTGVDNMRFVNFRRSLGLLLPSLYFLGTPDKRSRALEYRKPAVESEQTVDDDDGSKYWAIWYDGGAVEFRVFDTCYERPEAILDNVCVVANAMQFWTDTFVNPKLDDVCKRTDFGNDSSYLLERFYSTITHLELLDRGLKILKPSYYSIRQLKAQREFKTNKSSLRNKLKELRKETRLEYREYCERFEWRNKSQRYSLVADYVEALHQKYPDWEFKQVRREAEKLAETQTAERLAQKASLQNLIQEKIRNYEGNRGGNYRICAD